MIYGYVSGQMLAISNPVLAPGIKYHTAKFEFDDPFWSKCTTIVAMFDGPETYVKPLTNKFEIEERQSLNLVAGEYKVSLHGYNSTGGEITSTIAVIVVQETSDVLEDAEEADPSVLSESVSQCGSYASAALASKNAAKTSEDNAKGSADQAESSAATSAEKASAASQSATNATTQADRAKSEADRASDLAARVSASTEQVTTLKNSALNEIDSTKLTAINEITTSKSGALNAIEQKKTDILDDIESAIESYGEATKSISGIVLNDVLVYTQTRVVRPYTGPKTIMYPLRAGVIYTFYSDQSSSPVCFSNTRYAGEYIAASDIATIRGSVEYANTAGYRYAYARHTTTDGTAVNPRCETTVPLISRIEEDEAQIEENTENISTNTAAIATHNADIANLKADLTDLRKKILDYLNR